MCVCLYVYACMFVTVCTSVCVTLTLGGRQDRGPAGFHVSSKLHLPSPLLFYSLSISYLSFASLPFTPPLLSALYYTSNFFWISHSCVSPAVKTLFIWFVCVCAFVCSVTSHPVFSISDIHVSISSQLCLEDGWMVGWMDGWVDG